MPIWFIVLGLVLLIQAAALRSAIVQNVAPFVPRHYDQGAFLSESYAAYDAMQSKGVVRGLVDAVRQSRAQGWVLPAEAAALSVFVGPGRLTALDLNILYLLLWSGLTAELTRRRYGVAAGLVALGLLASLGTVTYFAGSVYDFRLDFAAMCLWGMVLAFMTLAWPSHPRATAAAVAAIGVVLIATRFITSVYLPPIAALILAAVWLRPRAFLPDDARQLRLGLGLVVVVWASVAAALFVANREHVMIYYVGGHVTSAEKEVRALEVGVHTLVDSLRYYPRSVIDDHTGPSFWVLATLSVAVGLVWRRLSQPLGPTWPSREWRWPTLVVLTGLVVPLVVLTVNQSKSPLVGNFLVPSTVLLVVVAFGNLVNRKYSNPPAIGLVVVGVMVLMAGLIVRLDGAVRPVYAPMPREEIQAATRLVDDLGALLSVRGNAPIVWSTDQHVDYLSMTSVTAWNWERRGRHLNLQPGLGQGPVHEILSPEQAREVALASDVLVISEAPMGESPAVFPSDQALAAHRPMLQELARQHMLLYRQVQIGNRDVFAYVRPSVALQGLQGDWMTSGGVSIALEAEAVTRVRRVVLEGQSELEWLPAPLATHAELLSPNGQRSPLASTFEAAGRHYTITIEVPAGLAVPEQPARIRLDFSTYFVPSVLGINSDVRQLVLRAPSSRRVELDPLRGELRPAIVRQDSDTSPPGQ